MNHSEEPRLYFETELGKIYHGNSLVVLGELKDRSVDLIMTSPPFGLVRKKDYGNAEADAYLDLNGLDPLPNSFGEFLKNKEAW